MSFSKLFGRKSEVSEVATVFSQLVSFTTISEALSLDQVARFMDEYLTQLSEPFIKAGAHVDFFGDTIVGFWRGRSAKEAANGAFAALTNAHGPLADLNKKLPALGFPSLHVSFGASVGQAYFGTMGHKSVQKLTACGDVINLAARLSNSGQHYGAQVIVSDGMKLAADDTKLAFRHLDDVLIKGRNEPVRIHEFLGARSTDTVALVQEFEKGRDAYRNQKWDEASQAFKNCLELTPNDGPSKIYLERISQMRQ